MAFTADKVRQGVQKDTGYSIDNSLRFNDDDSAYLSWTPGSAGNRKTWTWSGWYKMGNGGAGNWAMLFGADNGAGGDEGVYIRSNQVFMTYGGGSNLSATQVLRDPSAWYHLMVVRDTTLSTAGDRVKMYINGNRITDFGTETYPSQNAEGIVGVSGYSHEIMGNYHYVDGYLAEVHFIDGQALDPTSFGETGTYGEWKPIEVTGMTYGTNGFYLPFSNTGTKHTITANGDAQHSTAQSKIGSSSMYFDGSGDYLSLSSMDSLNLPTWTAECYWRTTTTSTTEQGIFASADHYFNLLYNRNSTNTLRLYLGTGSWTITGGTDGSKSDFASNTWYHIAVVYDGTDYKVYVNGSLDLTVSSSTKVGTNSNFYIGKGSTSTQLLNGYMDEIRISNTARYTTTFTPSTTAFTEDANTLLLIHSDTTNGSTTFTDDSGVVGGLGNDASSNTNNWTVNNLVATDQMLDSPTNNFCTWNPLYESSYTTSEGNLKWAGSTSTDSITFGTFGVASGLWYWEQYLTSSIHSPPKVTIGFSGHEDPLNMNIWSSSANKAYFWYPWNGSVYIAGTTYVPFSTTTASTGDVIGIAIDLDNGYMYLSKNGSWMNSGVPTSGATGTGGIPIVTGHTHYPLIDEGATGTSEIATANFGQDSSFAGNKTAQGNQDSNSIGDFYYAPPTGYLALCTQNLPEPTVVPSEHFNTVTYTGTGSSHSVTGVGFSPDLLWIKRRDTGSTSHNIFDRLRNTGLKTLSSDTTAAESSPAGIMDSLDSDGWTMNFGATNTNTGTYVAWNWKAGGAGVSNTNGTITSTVSANADAGFSIVSYTGTGATATVGHGLTLAVPEMVIVKRRSNTGNWYTYLEYLGATKAMRLDETLAAFTQSTAWNDTAPNTTVFSIGTSVDLNASGNTYIAYCFHSVEGYSKVGSYTANGSADGAFAYCGFKPAYVMIKNVSRSQEWIIKDTARDDDINPNSGALRPDSSNAASTAWNDLDFVSNGFKIRTSGNGINYASGDTMIFIAFAEHPFKYSTAK